MLRILSSIALSLFSFIAVTAQVKSFNLEDIHIRDPYILPDADTGLYYLYRSANGNRAESAVAKAGLTGRQTSRAGTKVGQSDP